MASASRRLYVGVTGHLVRRVDAHRAGDFEGFTKKYRMHAVGVRRVHVGRDRGYTKREADKGMV